MAVVNKGRLLDVVVTAMAARANLASKPTVERIVRQAQANAIESFESFVGIRLYVSPVSYVRYCIFGKGQSNALSAFFRYTLL